MRKTLQILGLTAVMLIAIDLAVAGVLKFAEDHDLVGSLVQYFEYGRSVPGKHARWIEKPSAPDNVYDMAWGSDVITRSRRVFAEEQPDQGPVIRAYGMSFVHHIMREVEEMEPTWPIDPHLGNGSPPNFTHALVLDDRENRRPGDVNVLGLLSSTIPALFALSSRTVVFEQPAPYSYPIFLPEGEGLRRIDPLVTSLAEERSLHLNPERERAWQNQLKEQDALYSTAAFAWPELDRSPLLRLVRRSLAVDAIAERKREITASGHEAEYPYQLVLQRMISSFAKMSREDGQIPFVLLIQTRNPQDVDLLAILSPTLKALDIPYLATADLFSPKNPSGYIPDGHFTRTANVRLARSLIKQIQANSALD